MEYLGIWEKINNPDFNYGEFDLIKSQAGKQQKEDKNKPFNNPFAELFGRDGL